MRREAHHTVDKFNYEVPTLTLTLNCNFVFLVSGYKKDYSEGFKGAQESYKWKIY